jgi:hypothetical protein
VAYLTLLLVDVARLATDVVGDLRRSDEPLLAEVFEVIEQRFTESLSLREVAATVGVTPGYLTTLVRRRTGRTVMAWITERGWSRSASCSPRPTCRSARSPVGSASRTPGTSHGCSDTATKYRHGHGATLPLQPTLAGPLPHRHGSATPPCRTTRG